MSAALRLLCVVAMTGCGRLDFDAIGAGGGGMADGNASCTYATPIAVQTAWSNLGMISTVQSITVEPTGARHLLVIGSAAYCNVKSVVDNAPGGSSTYTSANVGGFNGDGEFAEIWYAESSAPGATTVTVTWQNLGSGTGCPDDNIATFIELANASANLEPGGGTTNGNAAVIPAVTVATTEPGSIVFATENSQNGCTGIQGGNPFTGFGGSGSNVPAAYLIATNVGSYQAVFGEQGAGFYITSSIAFAPACN